MLCEPAPLALGGNQHTLVATIRRVSPCNTPRNGCPPRRACSRPGQRSRRSAATAAAAATATSLWAHAARSASGEDNPLRARAHGTRGTRRASERSSAAPGRRLAGRAKPTSERRVRTLGMRRRRYRRYRRRRGCGGVVCSRASSCHHAARGAVVRDASFDMHAPRVARPAVVVSGPPTASLCSRCPAAAAELPAASEPPACAPALRGVGGSSTRVLGVRLGPRGFWAAAELREVLCGGHSPPPPGHEQV